MQHDFIGAPSFANWNPGRSIINTMSSDAYASSYPSIRAISADYMEVRPYAVDANGKKSDNVPAVNALYHPNQQDSSVSFFEKIAVSTLVHRKTYILVWRKQGNEVLPGGEITPKNIAGYTFLEFPAVTRRDGQTFYKLGQSEFSDKEVMVLTGGVDPYHLYSGYSPNQASRSWAKLDDYIADYQAGFFENGAVPAGQFLITAPTVKDYDDMVDMIEARHRGAGKNGNVTFSHRPIDPNSGKAVDAQIEWIPFAQSNKDIDFKNLFEQTNKRIDLAYGVPQVVKGVDSTATYANSQVAEATFAKRAVRPLLLRNYTQITHELNRITNGFGYAITFNYEIPAIADEQKVIAETKNLEANLISRLVAEGYSLDTIIDSFELSKGYKLLKKDNTVAVIVNDKPDVDEGGEVNDSPDPNKVDGIKPQNKAIKVVAELSDEDKMANATKTYMQAQVDRAAQDYEDTVTNEVQPEPTENELDAYVDAMMIIVLAILITKGEAEYAAGIGLVESLVADELQGFALPSTADDTYRAYLRKVGTSYGDDTAKSIRDVLARSQAEGLSRADTEKALKEIMNTDDWRIKRLARTELNTSQNMGKLEGMKSLSSEIETSFEKTIDHSGVTPCSLCQSQEGIWKAIEQPLWSLGSTITDANGVTYVNDFVSNEASDYHPSGRGTLIFRRAE